MNEQRTKTKHARRPRLRREGDAGLMARCKLRALAEERGFATAHQAALEDLFGVITWLNDSIGSRETYAVVQGYADAVVEATIEHERKPPKRVKLRDDNDDPEVA